VAAARIAFARKVDGCGIGGTFTLWVVYHCWLIFRIARYLAVIRSELPPPILTGAQSEEKKQKAKQKEKEKEKGGAGGGGGGNIPRRNSMLGGFGGLGRSNSVFGSAMLGGRAEIPDSLERKKHQV
jgi:hypothetical protein